MKLLLYFLQKIFVPIALSFSQNIHTIVILMSPNMTVNSLVLGVRHVLRSSENVTDVYHALFDAVDQNSASHFVKHLKANGHIISIQDRTDKSLDPPFDPTINF